MTFQIKRHWDVFARVQQSFNMKGKPLRGIREGLIQSVSRAEAPGDIRKLHPIRPIGFMLDGDWKVHDVWMPADFKMARAVPIERSFLGWGTVMTPGFKGWLN